MTLLEFIKNCKPYWCGDYDLGNGHHLFVEGLNEFGSSIVEEQKEDNINLCDHCLIELFDNEDMIDNICDNYDNLNDSIEKYIEIGKEV